MGFHAKNWMKREDGDKNLISANKKGVFWTKI